MGKVTRTANPLAVLTQNIYRLMAAHNPPFTRNRLAADAGIDDTSLYRKLDHKPHTFTSEDLLGIAAALDAKPSDLWEGVGV